MLLSLGADVCAGKRERTSSITIGAAERVSAANYSLMFFFGYFDGTFRAVAAAT